MASTWIITRATRDGGKRYRVEFRVGGRESATRYGGSFRRKSDAVARRNWIAGELSALRMPDLRLLASEKAAPTLRDAAERWRESRVDVSPATATYQLSAFNRAHALHARRIDEITPADIAGLVAELAALGLARETIRKTVTVLSMILDFAGVQPNPARDRVRVKLPREERPEISPPSAEHVEAVYGLLARRYKLPLLVLDATGMRVGELEALTWGDVDEPRSRFRVSRAVAKTRYGRFVSVPAELFSAVLDLCPRDDRHPARRVFGNVTADNLRTAVARASTAAGVPTFSPHDLRHRRISLWHLAGVPWARIGEHVGQRDLAVTANTYTHVLTDERELATRRYCDEHSLHRSRRMALTRGRNCSNVTACARTVPTPVPTSALENGG
jgi:integrase